MIYLKSYEKFEKEQLSLFDNEEGYHKKDKAQDVATKFVNTYKSDNLTSNEKHLNTSESVIKEFNTRKKLKEMINHIVDDDRIGEYDRYNAAEIYAENNIEETVIAYNIVNNCDYFINKYNELVKNGEAKEDDITDYLQEIWDEYKIENINNVDDINKLIKDDLIDDKDYFIEFITQHYSDNDFDYTDVIDNELWNNIIDVLYESENNEIEIFRSIVLPNNMYDLEKELGNYDGVGKCWTWNEDSAEAYYASSSIGNNQEIVIHARVHVDNVNWYQTFYRSLYQLNDEREIHLVDGVTVDITGMDLKEKGNDLYRIKEKIINYIEKTYDFDWGKMNNIKSGYRKEIKEKSFLSFDPPIKVNV